MAIPINFETLKNNHPRSFQIKSRLRGPIANVIKVYKETCAIQVSDALNRSGAVIVNYEYPDPGLATGKVRAKQGSDGMNYIYSTLDMKVYLNKKYGVAEYYKDTEVRKMKAKVQGRKGIILFGRRHIDIWDRSEIHYQRHYIDFWTHAEANVKVRGIYFWEVKQPNN